MMVPTDVSASPKLQRSAPEGMAGVVKPICAHSVEAGEYGLSAHQCHPLLSSKYTATRTGLVDLYQLVTRYRVPVVANIVQLLLSCAVTIFRSPEESELIVS